MRAFRDADCEILRALRRGEEIGAAELMQRTELDPELMTKRLRSLSTRGLVRCRRVGYRRFAYRMTRAGCLRFALDAEPKTARALIAAWTEGRAC